MRPAAHLETRCAARARPFAPTCSLNSLLEELKQHVRASDFVDIAPSKSAEASYGCFRPRPKAFIWRFSMLKSIVSSSTAGATRASSFGVKRSCNCGFTQLRGEPRANHLRSSYELRSLKRTTKCISKHLPQDPFAGTVHRTGSILTHSCTNVPRPLKAFEALCAKRQLYSAIEPLGSRSPAT